MNVYTFVKKLKWSTNKEYPCFVYSECNNNEELDVMFNQLKDDGEIEIIWRDFKNGYRFYVDYYFIFTEEGMTQSYKSMIDL